MKYIIIIGDGMADRPLKQLGGKTPLQVAYTPNMDSLAKKGILGIVKTIPDGFSAGSDIANLSILGYDPKKYYSGRAPLEAASMGIKLSEEDVAYRCNLVTIKNEIMQDYSAGHITTNEAAELIKAIDDSIGSGSDKIKFYPGVSYRHIMLWKEGKINIKCVPPHDILDKNIKEYLPKGEGEEVLISVMEKAANILKTHPVNKRRISEGKSEANSIWLWGQGKKPVMPTFKEKYNITGALVSAVDLTKGLGIYAGFEILNVPGITGYIDTNYYAKAEYSLDALLRHDLVYIHVEAPDETGHIGDYKLKIKAIEDFDELLIGAILKGAEIFEKFKILLMPDHPTPVEVRTHTDEPVPFVIYDSENEKNNPIEGFSESIKDMKDILNIKQGYKLMDYFLKKD